MARWSRLAAHVGSETGNCTNGCGHPPSRPEPADRRSMRLEPIGFPARPDCSRSNTRAWLAPGKASVLAWTSKESSNRGLWNWETGRGEWTLAANEPAVKLALPQWVRYCPCSNFLLRVQVAYGWFASVSFRSVWPMLIRTLNRLRGTEIKRLFAALLHPVVAR